MYMGFLIVVIILTFPELVTKYHQRVADDELWDFLFAVALVQLSTDKQCATFGKKFDWRLASVWHIVMDGDMEQIMYMTKTHFQQMYISRVHNFITKARNSSKHVLLSAWRKHIANKYTPLSFKNLRNPFLVLLQMESN